MRIVFFGTPQIAADHLTALVQEKAFNVVGVVTQPDKPQGRGLSLVCPPVKALAQKFNINPIFQPENLKTSPVKQALEELKFDLGVVVAYGKILPKEILSIPEFGFINVHFSLLPELRGPSPVETAILQGLKKTGVTTFWINERMDAGPLIAQQETAIDPQETAATLKHKLDHLGVELLQKTIHSIILGQAAKIPQDESRATYSKIIKKEGGLVSWQGSAEMIDRMARAFGVWPKARAIISGKNCALLKVQVLDENNPDKKPGDITRVEKGRGFVIKCGLGSLLVEEVQPESKKAMSAADFLRGIQGGKHQ